MTAGAAFVRYAGRLEPRALVEHMTRVQDDYKWWLKNPEQRKPREVCAAFVAEGGCATDRVSGDSEDELATETAVESDVLERGCRQACEARGSAACARDSGSGIHVVPFEHEAARSHRRL